MLADYHLHTEFSDDSIEPMENQIEQAIRLGFDEICFTEHVDYGIKKDWTEGNFDYRKADPRPWLTERKPMANCNYPLYFAKLAEMKEKYGSRIVIRQGLEFGVQTVTLDRYEKLWDTYRDQLDFVLLSCHEVDNKEFWTGELSEGRTRREYTRMYYNEILECTKRFKHYSVLAHLDSIDLYQKEGRCPFEEVEDLVTEILRQAVVDGKGLEVNTSGLRKGLSYCHPDKHILRLYRQMGGTIVTFGSDAHVRKDLGFRIPEARKMVKEEIGIAGVCAFDHMEPVFFKI